MIAARSVTAALLLALLLAGCERGPTDSATPSTAAVAKVMAYPVESQLDTFEIRPNECAKELQKYVNAERDSHVRLYYLPGADPATGGAALDKPLNSKQLHLVWWHQTMDLNDDGLCDFLGSSFAGDDANGHQFAIAMRTGPGLGGDFYENFDSTDGYSGTYFEDRALDYRHSDNLPLPGTSNDKSIVLKISPKSGGMPYVVMPGYDINSPFRKDFEIDKETGEIDTGWPSLYVYRWDAQTRKFRQLADREKGGGSDQKSLREYLFGKPNAEYWNVRAYIAERYLQDGLKNFKARNYNSASIMLELAVAADPRNPDIRTWLGNLQYAGADFGRPGDGASHSYENAIAWTRARNLSVPPTLYFNLGLSYEARCWTQLQDRQPGEKPGCRGAPISNAENAPEGKSPAAYAQDAYQNYLKVAPNGERAAEVKQRLADMTRGDFREPVVDQDMAQSVAALDRFVKGYDQAQREIWQKAKTSEATVAARMWQEARAAAQAKPQPGAAINPETGQPANAPTADVFKLTPADLKKIDTEINRLLGLKGKSAPQSRIDWMVAYQAKFPNADLTDMIDRPDHYEALPWVKTWRKTYGELPR